MKTTCDGLDIRYEQVIDDLLDDFDGAEKVLVQPQGCALSGRAISATFDEGVPVLKCFYREKDYIQTMVDITEPTWAVRSSEATYFKISYLWYRVENEWFD